MFLKTLMSYCTLNFASFNVNGLGIQQQKKRLSIFRKLEQLNSISFLQETHCTKKDEKIWLDSWKGKIYFNHGTSQSAGVVILFPQNLDFELCEKKADLNGRLLITKSKIDNTTYVLCNIYAPTRQHKTDQNHFIKYLKETLIPYANENILLGGDFNFYLDLKLDKIDNMSNKSDNIIYRKEIISMLDSMNLTDCFRDLFPNIRRYTWHSRGKSSRLDYWFISEHLLNELENYKILPGVHSDHSIIYI